MPSISVIIPTYNNQATIEQCLKAVRGSISKDFELIVVDNGSCDNTPSIAAAYADKVLALEGEPNRRDMRNYGLKTAVGEVIVNIDSDVLIKPDTLGKIVSYFQQHPEIDALTGLLAREHPNEDFFSQYKNLYMNYIFKNLPQRINFLYGSIYALRRSVAEIYDPDIKIADDTALGQKLISSGKQIAFVKDLEVIHLKKYNLLSFIKNDFVIPYDWSYIFLKYQGYRQLGWNKTGYAHASRRQLISIIVASAVLMGLFLGNKVSPFIGALALAWFLLNLQFLFYLSKEKGLIFGFFSVFVTFIDNIVMALGVFFGLLMFFLTRQNVKAAKT